ncbi:MAG TPA: hypothetical protein ACFYED_01755 [Candidatus Tripitaka californicus]|uniref:hypothetical protein n=1 Tax=Candidatus Tripitaka californicus TaxID=3367616 RepID=UPI0040284771|nr:hypothetical protein [Planctomycetota bacterium]
MVWTVGSKKSLTAHCSVLIAYCLLPTVYCLLLVGCARGTDISNLYQYRFTMMYPSTGTLDFEDDALRFAFRPSRERIDLTIENKGAQPVELDWSKVEYEDRYGAVHKVTAQDVKPEEKDKPQAATIIAPGTRLETWVLPSDHVSRSIGRRKTKPLLPELKTAFDVDSWDRTTFYLVMPLKIGEEKKDYKFGFRARVD